MDTFTVSYTISADLLLKYADKIQSHVSEKKEKDRILFRILEDNP